MASYCLISTLYRAGEGSGNGSDRPSMGDSPEELVYSHRTKWVIVSADNIAALLRNVYLSGLAWTVPILQTLLITLKNKTKLNRVTKSIKKKKKKIQ